jgi:hypothetical protein
MEAISNAGAAIGMLCKDGVVLVAEKKITSKLLDTHAVGVRREKMYKLDDHVCTAVAGITGAKLGPCTCSDPSATVIHWHALHCACTGRQERNIVQHRMTSSVTGTCRTYVRTCCSHSAAAAAHPHQLPQLGACSRQLSACAQHTHDTPAFRQYVLCVQGLIHVSAGQYTM